MPTQTFPGTRTLPAETKGWAKPTPKNAIWRLGPCRWAIGCHKLLERLVNGPMPNDAEATWTDHDSVRYCIRPRPADMGPDFKEQSVQIGIFRDGDHIPMAGSWRGVFRIGTGVVLKAKWLGWGGRPGEPAAMQLIRRAAPHVPVPRVMHHWEDEDWNCYFTIMSEVSGADLYRSWCDLEEEHRNRIAREIAQYLKVVGTITSKYAIYADGSPHDGHCKLTGGDDTLNDMDVKLTRGPRPFTAEEHIEHVRKTLLHEWQTLPASWGDELFYLCHMDLRMDHFFISDGRPNPPVDERDLIKWPLERQADLRVVGIIDWEKAAFYPHTFVTLQVLEEYDHFLKAVVREMVAIGCPHPRDSPVQGMLDIEDWAKHLSI